MDTFLGVIVGFGTALIWGRWVSIFFRVWKPSEISLWIFSFVVFIPLYFLWYNGNTSWEPYGELDFGNIFSSLLMWPIEIASGIENLFDLETGTLGGWPAY